MSIIQIIYRDDGGTETSVSLRVNDPVAGESVDQPNYKMSPTIAACMADDRAVDAWVKTNSEDIKVALYNLIGHRLHRSRNPEGGAA